MSYYQVRISSKSLTTFTDFSCVFLFEFFDDGKVQLLLLGIYKSTCQFQCLCLQFQGGNMIGFCCTESPIPLLVHLMQGQLTKKHKTELIGFSPPEYLYLPLRHDPLVHFISSICIFKNGLNKSFVH